MFIFISLNKREKVNYEEGELPERGRARAPEQLPRQRATWASGEFKDAPNAGEHLEVGRPAFRIHMDNLPAL